MKDVYLERPDGHTVRASVQVARIAKLSDFGTPKASGADIGTGSVVILRATSKLLAVSRRDGGLRHRFGVVDSDEQGSFGTMFILADDELHVVAMDLSAPEVQGLLSESRTQGRLRLLMTDSAGDMRLMVPPLSDDVLVLLDEATTAKERGAFEFVRNLGQALRYCVSEEVLRELSLDSQSIREVHISCLVSESILDRLMQAIQGPKTLN